MLPTAASASKGLASGLLAAFLLVAAAPPSEANVIYHYEDVPFDTITGTTYTTSDFVIIDLEFASLLPAFSGTLFLTDSVLGWSFMDGQQAFSNTGAGQLNALVFVGTDLNSLPVMWQVSASAVGGGLNSGARITTNFTNPTNGHNLGFLTSDEQGLVNVNPPGVWSIVPEPSTLSLAALGLLGLAANGRRRKP